MNNTWMEDVGFHSATWIWILQQGHQILLGEKKEILENFKIKYQIFDKYNIV